MSDDNITGSVQPVFQTNDNDINTSLDHNSANGDDSNENIDTGSEFDDLYSHEEDNDEQEEKEDQNDSSNNDNDNVNAEYSTAETHQEELNMHNDLSDKENDATSKEYEDKEQEQEQEQETQTEENNNKKTDVEAGRLEKSDSSSGSDSESTSGSEEEGEDDDDDNDDNEEEEEDDDDEEEDEEQEDTEDADTEEKKDDTKNLKDVNFNLLERQIKYLVDSDMLHSDDFKALSKEGKITAIINLVNSNSETALSGYTKNSNNSQNQSTTTTSSFSSSASNNKQALDYSNDSKPSSTSSTKDKPASKYERPNLFMPMTLKERDLYAAYLRGENKITEMHNIPAKSRLFIGNLPLKNVTKEDLFRIFIPYGHILQINIKNAFGFIQYDNPTSVLEAIKYESDEINFGKKLILEVSSSNSRPQFDHGDHGTNSSSTFISSSKRPFQTDGSDDGDLYNDGTGYKKPKRRVPHCVIYVKRTADRTFATEVFNSIKNGTGIETDMIFLKPRMELRKLINDAAYDGSWGVIIVNKSRNLDIQIFYEGPSGETKFDEYVNISCPDAVSIFNNIKNQRRGTMGIGMMPGSANMYGGYNQPPMGPNINAGYGYGSRYGSIPPQQIPQPPQGYMSYQAPGTNGYQAPPPPQQQPPVYGGMNQTNYSRYQNQPAPPPPQGSMGMGQAYGKYPPQASAVNQTPAAIGTAPPQQSILTQSPPQNNVQPQLSAALNGNPTQMDQQQLLAAIQNLPPNVVSSLLSAAQQQQQPPNQQQQQLLGMLQNTQNQQTNQPQNTYSQMSGSSSYDSSKMQSQPQPQNQPPPQQQPGSNVQSLLDSLAKLQK